MNQRASEFEQALAAREPSARIMWQEPRGEWQGFELVCKGRVFVGLLPLERPFNMNAAIDEFTR